MRHELKSLMMFKKEHDTNTNCQITHRSSLDVQQMQLIHQYLISRIINLIVDSIYLVIFMIIVL